MSEPKVVSERFVEREDTPFVDVKYSNGTASLFRIFANGSRKELDGLDAASVLPKSRRVDKKTALALAVSHDATFADRKPAGA